MRKILIVVLFFINIFNFSEDNIKLFDSANWYKSQIDTGVGNCGPACAAMLVQRSGVDITVEDARKLIGYKAEDGATGIFELLFILQLYYIDYKFLKNLDCYYGSGVVLVVVDAKYISNRGYTYGEGHYIIITGILDNRYYLVHDPISGPNKAYKISEVKRALKYKPVWIE